MYRARGSTSERIKDHPPSRHHTISKEIRKICGCTALQVERLAHASNPIAIQIHIIHTHIIASATSVTRNLLSTSHSCPTLPTMAAAQPSRPIPGLICSSSAKKVNAHRSPHHAAGSVLSARHTSSGMCHLRSTPRITATRGCSGEDAVWPASLPSGVLGASGVGDGGATAGVV